MTTWKGWPIMYYPGLQIKHIILFITKHIRWNVYSFLASCVSIRCPHYSYLLTSTHVRFVALYRQSFLVKNRALWFGRFAIFIPQKIELRHRFHIYLHRISDIHSSNLTKPNHCCFLRKCNVSLVKVSNVTLNDDYR